MNVKKVIEDRLLALPGRVVQDRIRPISVREDALERGMEDIVLCIDHQYGCDAEGIKRVLRRLGIR